MTIELFDDKPETLQAHNSFVGLFNYLTAERVKFFDDAYYAYPLADYLYGKVPASIAMPIAEWRNSFNHTIQAFNLSGTFETYLTMLHALFGVDAIITFVVAAPAELEITINITNNQGTTEDVFITEAEESIVDDEDNEIVFIKILEQINDADLQQVLQATSPVGIKVTFTIVS